MPRVVIHGLTVVLSLAALIGFAALMIVGIVAALSATTTPSFPAAQVQLAAILSGLVGGVVAAGFGQKPPDAVNTPHTADSVTPAARESAGAAGGQEGRRAPAASESLLDRNISALGRLFFGPPSRRPGVEAAGEGTGTDWKAVVAGIYAVVYVLLGLAAIAVTYALRPDVTPDLVRNTAAVCVGLFLAIIRSFMDI